MKAQCKIMIVEDDFIIRLFIENVVKELQFMIVAKCTTGEDAINNFIQHKPDLILMDIGIKGKMDGIDTAKKIHDHGKCDIIFMTGNSDDKTIERATETTPIGFIFKPIDELKLRHELMAYLEKNNAN